MRELNYARLIIKRDLMLAWREPADFLARIMFFIIVANLFPFGVGSDLFLLKKIAAGVLWVCALLSLLLALPRLFAEDHQDGSLEQLALLPYSLSTFAAAKIYAYWLSAALPLIFLAPLLGLQYNLPYSAQILLVLTLLIGTPAIAALGSLGAALTLGLKNSAILFSLIILPLCTPILIFAAGVVDTHLAGLPIGGHLALLTSFTLIICSIAPWVCAVALRLTLE